MSTSVAAPSKIRTGTAPTYRVVHLAPGHVPFDTRVFHKEARTLAGAGYEVTVVAPHDRNEIVDGVRVVGLPRPGGRLERFVLGPVRLLRVAWRERADVYHLHDIEAVPVGVLLALLGRTVIWDSHEDYPRLVLDRPWIPRWLRRPVSRAVAGGERLAARAMAGVISAEHEGARRFPAAKTMVVGNAPRREEFSVPGPPFEGRDNVLVYVGAITRQRGAAEMIDLVHRLDPRLGARLVLVGRFGERDLEAELRARPGWDRVEYRGEQSRDGVREALNEARVGLVLWHPTRKHAEGAVPVKLLEYMAAGLPVIASDFPVMQELLAPTDAGELVDPLDLDAIAAAADRVLADPRRAQQMGDRGRAHVLAERTWSREVPELLAMYERVLERR